MRCESSVIIQAVMLTSGIIAVIYLVPSLL